MTDRPNVSDTSRRFSAEVDGHYRIERELGTGGMATVYLAHDLKHDRDVAIKVLHPELAAALGGERFLSEIRTTARLQHPHILPLLDSGEAGGLLYYVMPFVAGETLRARGSSASDSFRSTTPCALRAKSPTRSAPLTSSASFIATSSPRTYCSQAGMRWSPTSASRSRFSRPAGSG